MEIRKWKYSTMEIRSIWEINCVTLHLLMLKVNTSYEKIVIKFSGNIQNQGVSF